MFPNKKNREQKQFQFSRGNFRKNWRGKNWRGNLYNKKSHSNVRRDIDQDSQLSDIQLPETSQLCATPALVLDTDLSSGPYAAWKAYLPGEPYKEESGIVKKLRIIERYLSKVVEHKKAEIDARHSFTIDVNVLCTDEEFIAKWPEFSDDLRNSAKNVISYFGLAMHNILCKQRSQEIRQCSPSASSIDDQDDTEVPLVYARFVGLELLPFKNLKTNTYRKFVAVKGTVVRVGNIKPLCVKLAFKCNRCFSQQVVLQPSGNYTAPNRCITKPCNSRSFQPLRNSSLTQLIPLQNIRLQEISNDDTCEKGRVPRTIECELVRDLVDRCVPGDIVTVSGIVKVSDPKEKTFGVVKSKSTYVLYILANSIQCLREKRPESHDVMPGGMQLDIEDLYIVREIHSQDRLFRLIVASLCPNIYGHEIVKAGLVLSLFGGTQQYAEDANRVPVRGDSHILIVGDPGLGKSQMLLACTNASPRGVYVCGNTTTSSGLTVTLTKEPGGENGLDAGALVLADQGCCCIDEFDKMTSQHHALLEAMEQQTVSIAKSGLACVLPARTSIIAAANPVGGHYNKAKTVSENIKLGSALLSRFDLVFIVVDKADIEMDSKLSAHVMAMHTGKSNMMLKSVSKQRLNCSNESNCSLLEGKNQLVESLRFEPHENLNTIPVDQLRKYIAYARKYVHPKLSQEAAQILQNFYLELRKQHQSPHSTPITNRQLESMIRLTEARARVELREVCSADDAQEIVDIMKYSMIDTYSDEFGNIDFERSIHGSGMSKRSKAKTFLSRLSVIASQTGNCFFTVHQMEGIAKDAGIDIMAFGDFIENLNNQGYLIKKGPRLYQLQTL